MSGCAGFLRLVATGTMNNLLLISMTPSGAPPFHFSISSAWRVTVDFFKKVYLTLVPFDVVFEGLSNGVYDLGYLFKDIF